MAVNDEPGELDRLLDVAPELVAPGGRIVIISFMSLDDRKVKIRFRELAAVGRAKILTKHPLQPSEEEIAQNAASRSAKLRAIEVEASS
jgi:16S rRNA (cytosine1402-N4)-methyltransferase